MSDTLLNPSLVYFDIDASTPDEFFAELESRLMAASYIEPTWRGAISQREKNFPTGLATPCASIAIPHTDPQHIKRAYIAIVKPVKPITFNPMGGEGDPVDAQLIINLGLKGSHSQVDMLQSLMGIFLDESKAERVLAQTDGVGMVRAFQEFGIA